MKRNWMLFGIILLVLSGCREKEPEGTIFVSGRIDGDTVDISSKIPGRITTLTVREGDPVEAGQVVASLSSDQFDARRDAQRALVVAEQRTVEQLQRQLATYGEKIRQAQLYTDQAETNAPGQVKQAEADLAARKAELARWEAELKQAQIDAQRYPPLAKTGAVAPQLSEQYQTKETVAQQSTDAARKQVAAAEAALQQAQSQMQNIPIQAANRQTLERQVDELKAQIASAQADVEANKADLRKAEADIADLTIHAPIAGTILTRSAEPGRVIEAGQTIFTMVDLHKLYLRGFVPEGTVGKVKVGQRAQVWLDSNPKEAVPAQVIRIDPQVMFTPENTYFKEDRVKQVMGLKLGLLGAYGYAKPGMPADGRIYTQEQTQGQAGRP
ncbi:MAG: HlyD family secretion protein [Acidobacteriaceae bacterium]|nr:HlyD family secretion protein [Acidobacteriaceae bacterium]